MIADNSIIIVLTTFVVVVHVIPTVYGTIEDRSEDVVQRFIQYRTKHWRCFAV